MIRRIRESYGQAALTLAQFKQLVREQFLMLLLDPKKAVAAIPAMLPAEPTRRSEALGLIREALLSSADISGETKTRFEEIARIFEPAGQNGAQRPVRIAQHSEAPAKAS